MRARRIIINGSFGPDDVVYLTGVLESVWLDVEPIQRQCGLDKSTAREGLALAILYLAPRSADLSLEEFRERVKSAFIEQAQLSLSALG
jgi:hypothetical protein